jgi:hypothetical protein
LLFGTARDNGWNDEVFRAILFVSFAQRIVGAPHQT